MTVRKNRYRPSIGDAAVAAKTGKTWKQWFSLLDKKKAYALPHKSIARFLKEKMKLPSWWAQMIAVEYERARGLRKKNETSSGFSVSISKTIPCKLATLFTTAAKAEWFPAGKFSLSSVVKNKSMRGTWKAGARLELSFVAKAANKAQIAAQITKLAKKSDVERERTDWRKALQKLGVLSCLKPISARN